MSFDVTTLALAKSYTDQHGGSGGGASTAGGVSYTNEQLADVTNVKGALDELVEDAHTHSNKSVLDKFAETDGKPTYNGDPIGGENTIYIPATLNFSDDIFTIETSATFEQIDTAYKSGQEQILKVFFSDSGGAGSYLMSISVAFPGNAYYFGTFYAEYGMLVVVRPSDKWSFAMYDLIGHMHDNKTVLDKLSDSNGKLQYNGSDVGLKGDKGDKGDTGAQGEPGKDGADGKDGAPGTPGKTPVKGTDYWTAADKQEIVNDVIAALPDGTEVSY